MSIDPKQCNKLKFCEYRKTKLVQNVEIKNAWHVPRKRCLSGKLILLSNRITVQKSWALETSKFGVFTVYPITISSIFPRWYFDLYSANMSTSPRCHFLDQSRSCRWSVLTPQGKIETNCLPFVWFYLIYTFLFFIFSQTIRNK